MFMDLFGGEMCVGTYTSEWWCMFAPNGDVLFVQGYSCRKENVHSGISNMKIQTL
jgi:hypothetical protein